MKYPEYITIFNSFIQRQCLYQFLVGIPDTFDKERRDLLNRDPLPTLDEAYATIRCEIALQGIMTVASSSGFFPSKIVQGLVMRHRSEMLSQRDIDNSNRDKSHLRCSYCGGSKHTKEGCFKILRYPKWWDEHQQRKVAAA